jgi:hypothetical protein
MVYVIQNNRVILARPHKVMVRYERIRLIHGGDAGVKFIHGFTDKRQTVLVPLLYNSFKFYCTRKSWGLSYRRIYT